MVQRMSTQQELQTLLVEQHHFHNDFRIQYVFTNFKNQHAQHQFVPQPQSKFSAHAISQTS